MELLFPSLFFTIIFSIFILLKPKKPTPNLPPGPRPWPLIGNIHNLIGPLTHRAMHRLAQKHGPLMHVRLGEVSTVVVSTPEAAKLIMKTHDINFSSRPSILVTEIFSYNCTNIAFAPYGDYWRQLRKICALELLSAKRVQSFRPLREEVFLELMRWIGGKEGTPFNFKEKLYTTTYAQIGRAVLGKMTKEREKLLPMIQEALAFAAGFDISDVYPSIKLLKRMSSMRRRLNIIHDVVDKILDDIIHDHKVAETSGEKQEDLVDVLLKYQDDGLELPLTNDNIKAVILDILAGGSEAASITMHWAMAELLKNPEILEKVQQEVRAVFDNKGSCVDESCVHELTYLKLVVKETLRLHPPLPLSVLRKCSETCEINGYQIPANTRIIINAWAINRDPNYWKDGDCFQPERFVDTDVDFKGNHFEYIPFGAGRRICPGLAFGLATVELPLAMMLYHFNWSTPDGKNLQDMDILDIEKGVKDLCVIPHLKRPLPLPLIK